jgi:hypothetical protein
MTEVSIEVSAMRFLKASTEAKIWQFDMSWRIQEQVIGFDVSMDKAQLVDVLDG